MARARITLPLPPTIPPFPKWARPRTTEKNPEEASFFAGAALAALHPIACHDHPIGALWRRLAERNPLDQASRLGPRPKDWMIDLTNTLDVRLDPALEDVGTDATFGASAVAAVSLEKRPDAEALALWLADAVLAHCLKWPAPVPLIASQFRRHDLCAAARRDDDGAWTTPWTLAYARAAAAAVDLYADLVRRAHHLLAAGPQLRGRDAARRVEMAPRRG